ncbi:hypothetical protein [Microbulbifer sp. THAF38]|uniref:hypothetical protein n=1 Tax=Microbulbifer sp. THAF38 TaxID=2587856 RepID=UPI00126913CE|nr:hypothetical protein [Microbulbifer sp. THAF38]QFT53284.1 hypothetical protein FIU95_01645 [Microbulbifer sp. THAF38]
MSNKHIYLKGLLFWSILFSTYLVTLNFPATEFAWKLLLIFTALLYFCTNRDKFQRSIIDDPISYVRFDGEFMIIGDLSIKKSAIRKIAIDSVKDRGYFSLPYNQLSPGKIPEFVFPSNKVISFCEYLKQEFPSNVEFIT